MMRERDHLPKARPARGIMSRALDRAWREYGRCFAREVPGVAGGLTHGRDATSVSEGTGWVECCRRAGAGEMDCGFFRRLVPVREIVETVGFSEARHYARLARRWGNDRLVDSRVRQIDEWGGPLRLPGVLLGTSSAFSPTTLRYLATALWLRRRGVIGEGTRIVEVGVGFGGLAAMNAVLSGARTLLVDLPEVERLAARMLRDCGVGGFGQESARGDASGADGFDLFVSNYAFTELNTAEQDRYGERYLARSRHGLILSNAGVFSKQAGGRNDKDLLGWLRGLGVDAVSDDVDDLLGPIDHLCGNRLIFW